MTSDFCMALDLDKEDLCGKVVAVIENAGSNANFVINALISHCVDVKTPVCLLALHNTFGHYHNVGVKLGTNLQKLRDEGLFNCIELLKLVQASLNDSTTDINFLSNKDPRVDPLKSLFLLLKRQVENILSSQNSVCIMIDDLSDLLALGCGRFQVLSFFQYCRSLVYDLSGCSLVVLCHANKLDAESMKIVAGLSHMSDLKVEITGLNTGVSGDVSGMLSVDRTDNASIIIRKKYHFKLEERRIFVFPPGTSRAFV